MTDGELRGIYLRQLYELRRKERFVEFPEPPLDGDVANRSRLCKQLKEMGLIRWEQGLSDLDGSGMITALGVDVVEGNAPEPRGVVVNRNVTISHSSHVQVGTGNTQNVTLTIQKLVEAVEHSDAPEPEKKKAKALIQKLSENRLLATVIGSLIGSQIS